MYREGKKCVIYVRVSTEMQVDGYSLDGQRNILKIYAEREGMIIIDTYEDAGKSGKSIEGRPAFQKMINDIENGLAIDYILVYKLSRFGRNTTDVLNSLELIQQYDVNLISVEDGIDSSQSSGKLLISLLSSVSEIERENIIEQTMNGRREKARQGEWNGGFAPYGYDLINGKLIINENEAEVIRMIFDLFANTNYGIDKICKELNHQGIKKVVRQNGTLDRWSRTIVTKILDNPVYVGKIAFGRRSKEKIKGTKNDYHMVPQKEYIVAEGKHEAIISEELWNKVQEKREETGRKIYQSIIGQQRVHLLSGILKCPKCGGPMYANKYCHKYKNGIYKERYYYYCANSKYERGVECNSTLKIFKPDIEPYLIELIKSLLNDNDFIKEVKDQITDKTDTKSLEKEKANYQKQLKIILENKKRLENDIDNMPLDMKHRDKMLTDMNNRLYSLYDTIDKIEEKIKNVDIKMASIEYGKVSLENVMLMLKEFHKLYELMTDEEKKEAISGIVKEIHVYDKPIDGNYIKTVKLNFNIYNIDSYSFEIPGNKIYLPDDIRYGYKENTSIEISPSGKISKSSNKKVTYKMIKEYVKEKYDLFVHTSYIAEVKRDLGITMINDRSKEITRHKVKHPTQKHRDAIEDALRNFKII